MQDTTIAWLAGLIDGQASIYLIEVFSKTNTASFGNHLAIQTSSIRVYEKVQTVLDDLQVNYRVESAKQTKSGIKLSRRILVSRKLELKKLLEIIIPYLYVKLPEAKVMLEYLEKTCETSKYKISDADYEYLEKLKVLKDNS